MNISQPTNSLILASAGSGKTHRIRNCVIGLVTKGVAPEKIVALTFTRKAAGEFADVILRNLAVAAEDEKEAEKLRDEIQMPGADFSEALEQVVRALPRITLGTIDSFFASVVRAFQYELGLTGGKFDLIEGSRATAVTEEILAELLGERQIAGREDEFIRAFRRATIGKEQQSIARNLREFVASWQSLYRTTDQAEWGPGFLAEAKVEDWEKQKHSLAAKVRRDSASISGLKAYQQEAFEEAIQVFENHTIGSGSLGKASSLVAHILSAVQSGDATLVLKYRSEFTLTGPAADALREMVHLAASCEMAAALQRTQAVREVVAVYDERCENRLRRRGMLTFDDIKMLMADWVRSEEARLTREAIDFRLDARYDHWLLDEYQDTSRADWTGLLPLVEEAASGGEGSLFIVGDKKQAIYGWRGGDVSLFDEIIAHWKLEPEPMAKSWRSCPEVLELVNRVCGDTATMRELFGEAAERWDWQEHVSAEPLRDAKKRGEARVEILDGEWEDHLERVSSLLEELGVQERGLTCGVLVRSNDKVKQVAEHLRSRGFEVIEEGRREPAKDNPIGVVMLHLLKWLANPADAFAREVIAMSPVAEIFLKRFGEDWQCAWEILTDEASANGFAAMMESLICDEVARWSEFGRRRAGDIITALEQLDARGIVTAQEAADWIERLEVAQSPGAAAVQVMTIHKSKGLGFDVVILPAIPKDKVPNMRYFEVALGEGWISQVPPQWARDLIPEMRDAEAHWAAGQIYEAFCLLYVALTRAKRGLYVLLEKPAAKQSEDQVSLANWMMRSIECSGEVGVAYQSGSPSWIETVPPSGRSQSQQNAVLLGKAVPRRKRTTPSKMKSKGAPTFAGAMSGDGKNMEFGTEVHAVFESISWIDEEQPRFSNNLAEQLVQRTLKQPEIAQLFSRENRAITLFREQPVDAVLEDTWLSGVIDRMHVHRDASGLVTLVEVIDFKTDAVKNGAELIEKYSGQLECYREVMQLIYPAAKIECLLVSTALGKVIC